MWVIRSYNWLRFNRSALCTYLDRMLLHVTHFPFFFFSFNPESIRDYLKHAQVIPSFATHLAGSPVKFHKCNVAQKISNEITIRERYGIQLSIGNSRTRNVHILHEIIAGVISTTDETARWRHTREKNLCERLSLFLRFAPSGMLRRYIRLLDLWKRGFPRFFSQWISHV